MSLRAVSTVSRLHGIFVNQSYLLVCEACDVVLDLSTGKDMTSDLLSVVDSDYDFMYTLIFLCLLQKGRSRMPEHQPRQVETVALAFSQN